MIARFPRAAGWEAGVQPVEIAPGMPYGCHDVIKRIPVAVNLTVDHPERLREADGRAISQPLRQAQAQRALQPRAALGAFLLRRVGGHPPPVQGLDDHLLEQTPVQTSVE